jgi:hypothetical protein
MYVQYMIFPNIKDERVLFVSACSAHLALPTSPYGEFYTFMFHILPRVSFRCSCIMVFSEHTAVASYRPCECMAVFSFMCCQCPVCPHTINASYLLSYSTLKSCRLGLLRVLFIFSWHSSAVVILNITCWFLGLQLDT